MSSSNRTVVLGPGEGKTVSVMGDQLIYKVVSADTRGAYGLVELVIEAHGPPPHVHRNEDEGFYVLEGELDIQVGERKVRATTGSFVFGPRGVVHTYSKVGVGPAKLLEIFSPAGFEHFFEEIDGSHDIDQIKSVAEKYNMEIVGPPLGA